MSEAIKDKMDLALNRLEIAEKLIENRPVSIYVVYGACDYEGCGSPVRCFTSYQLAEQFIFKVCEVDDMSRVDGYDIAECSLDDFDMTDYARKKYTPSGHLFIGSELQK